MKGNKPSIIKTHDGMTMIQVIITMALIGVMSMMLMRMTSVMQKNQTSLEKNVEVDFFIKKMGSYLISKNNCQETFQGTEAILDTPVDIPTILGGGTAVIDFATNTGTQVGTTVRNSTALVSITLTRIATAEARLSFRFDRGENTNAKKYFGARFFNRNIPIILNIDSNDIIQGCYGDLNNSLEASCTKLGGEFDPVAGVCLIFDLAYNQHSSQQCEAIGGTVSIDTLPDGTEVKYCRLSYTQYENVKGWTPYKDFTSTDANVNTLVPPAGTVCVPEILANTVPREFVITNDVDRDAFAAAITSYNSGTNPMTLYKPATPAVEYQQCTLVDFHNGNFVDERVEECETPAIAGVPVDPYNECKKWFKANILEIGVY